MTLTDASALTALINADEPDHAACVRTFDTVRLPLVATWPAFAEAMHILGRRGGHFGQSKLWLLIRNGSLRLADLAPAAIERSAWLMDKYADVPMDLADATLVAVAEERQETLIFTLDSDFEIYRLHGRRRFRIVPK